jgi:hypothetical protein
MNTFLTVTLGLGFSALSMAQTVSGIAATYPNSRANQEMAAQRRSLRQAKPAAGQSPHVVVFTGDRVIPQFVDGGSWQTAITVVNLENHSTEFDVLFFDDNGNDFAAPISGQGLLKGIHIILNTAGSYTFETTGRNPDLSSGWALLSQSNNDSVGIFAIFRQSVPGRQVQEAVVPSVNQFSSHFVLPFDNTQYSTGIALANPTLNTVVIPANIRNEQGQIIDTRQLTLGPYSHTAFAMPDRWSSTVGRRGIIEFLTSGFGVGALGLRFNGSAFTSLNVLENLAWTQ